MKTTKLLLTIGIGLTVLTACKDNETPYNEDWCLDPTYKVPLAVKINIDKTFSNYTEVDSTAMDAGQYRSTTRGDPSWQMMYHIGVFGKDKTTPVEVFSSFDNPVKIDVHPGKYTFVGWASLSPPIEDSRSFYYNLDDFDEIMLKHKYNYDVDDPYKIPYRGLDDFSVAWTDNGMELNLTPAMAQFKLIATDQPDYTPAKTVISYYKVPAAINGYTGKINYMWDDVQFESTIKDDLLASDYVLSESSETEVFVKIEIYDEEGNLQARLSKLRIPLINGGITTVKGNFYSILDLTGLDAGGISIDTEFEGTFEIQI